MHPEMTYRIAILRHEERLRARRFPTPIDDRRRRRWFRRRRDPLATGRGEQVSVVLLPPPREERAADHDRHVA